MFDHNRNQNPNILGISKKNLCTPLLFCIQDFLLNIERIPNGWSFLGPSQFIPRLIISEKELAVEQISNYIQELLKLQPIFTYRDIIRNVCGTNCEWIKGKIIAPRCLPCGHLTETVASTEQVIKRNLNRFVNKNNNSLALVFGACMCSASI